MAAHRIYAEPVLAAYIYIYKYIKRICVLISSMHVKYSVVVMYHVRSAKPRQIAQPPNHRVV